MSKIYIVGLGGTRGEFTPEKAFKIKSKAEKYKKELHDENGRMHPYYWTIKEVDLL
jgi:hypothetical protein